MTGRGGPPLIPRLRLKATRDLSGFAPPLQRIFRAMQIYGLIVADHGSHMYISGTMDPRWNNDVLNPAFRSLTADDFEVIEPRLASQPGAAGLDGPSRRALSSPQPRAASRRRLELGWRPAAGRQPQPCP